MKKLIQTLILSSQGGVSGLAPFVSTIPFLGVCVEHGDTRFRVFLSYTFLRTGLRYTLWVTKKVPNSSPQSHLT